MKDEKNPVALVGCDKVPPGVLSSSAVEANGARTEFESLLGTLPDWARRCLILSMELSGRLTGGDPAGASVASFLENSPLGSVGVGGVTSVVGVSTRLSGVV